MPQSARPDRLLTATGGLGSGDAKNAGFGWNRRSKIKPWSLRFHGQLLSQLRPSCKPQNVTRSTASACAEDPEQLGILPRPPPIRLPPNNAHVQFRDRHLQAEFAHSLDVTERQTGFDTLQSFLQYRPVQSASRISDWILCCAL